MKRDANASNSLTVGGDWPGWHTEHREGWGLRCPMLNASRATRGNAASMMGKLGGSLMQMGQKGDFSSALPSKANRFIIISLSRKFGVVRWTSPKT